MSADGMIADDTGHEASESNRTPQSDMAQPYMALALQATCFAVNAAADRAAARVRMRASIDRLEGLIAGSKAFIGPDLRLVQLPEYLLTSYPTRDSIAGWREKAAIAPDGAIYQRLGQAAERLGVYLAGNAYETDPHFPALYFQTCFVIDDRGEIVLRYRRLNSMFAPTPHDVWDRYLEFYGPEAIFPVADTPLGRLGAVASEEILFPEVARALALRGAEVLLHPTSEAFGDGDTPKDIAKRARAIENLAYVVSANTAGIEDAGIPAASADGGSKIIDYRGQVLARAAGGETLTAYAEIDIASLRRWRRRPGMMNLLARHRPEVYRDTAGHLRVHPPNGFARDGEPARSTFRRAHEATIQRLIDAGIL